MGWCIGVDEAGLGPKLGPLVVAATIWEVPGLPRLDALWSALADVIAPQPEESADRLVVADSKLLFKPDTGPATLERTVLAMLAWCRALPTNLHELMRLVGEDGPTDCPWYHGTALCLPLTHDPREIWQKAEQLRQRGQAAGVQLRGIVARVVQPATFNRLLDESRNKSVAVAAVHRDVTRIACQLAGEEPVLLVSDKHGGRHFYAAYLSELLDGAWITTVEEGPQLSVYRCDRFEFRFEPRAERYAPVALASMMAKYLRELHMLQFNGFWRERLPDLRPTQGYPVDAERFWHEIEPLLSELRIMRHMVWRER